jgi:hypothetical protein
MLHMGMPGKPERGARQLCHTYAPETDLHGLDI